MTFAAGFLVATLLSIVIHTIFPSKPATQIEKGFLFDGIIPPDPPPIYQPENPLDSIPPREKQQ